jgi:hypothetical protein
MANPPLEEVEPRRLELILNPEDGSLQTAPLLNVIMSATDVLYTDIYNMAHGELEVTSAQPLPGADEEEEEQQLQDVATNSQSTNRKEKMASLSFAQRRHELGWRLASHSRTLTHVAAITAANATTNMANATRISTHALQHARTAWVQADEAQDALYFFHARLFPARAGPHDVYGALDTMLAGAWPDLPQDLQLTVDRYEKSDEKAWNAVEVADRWQMAVRDKLLRGEMGWMKQNQVNAPWKISLRGGIVRLTHGRPKTTISGSTTNTTYPIEAILTVLSTNHPALWTLVSVEVHAQARTGQSNHQLDTSNRQRFNLHRLCALAMNKEERRVMAEEKETELTDDMPDETDDATPIPKLVARPLHSLFQVAHVFGLSWQLEILSAQAQSIRKGTWGTKSSSILVTPVQFFENRRILGIVSISFWSVDDRYGPPLIADLELEDELLTSEVTNGNRSSSDSVSTVSRSINTPSVTNQLTLSIRAEANVGIRVALSGAENIMECASVQPHVRSAIRALLEATSNPFSLSASEALLAATRLCAERKCYAMVQVLPPFLPPWITLSVEKGSIAVAARIQYHTGSPSGDASNPVVLFRLTCDARTGSFVSTFARNTELLRYLACNDPGAASDTTAVRIAQYTKVRQAGRSANAGTAAALASGRVVRDAFEGLSRSMNALGQRTGVGGGWKDIDDMSASLRRRAVELACKDVRVSLISCCGMAAVFGMCALSMNTATGVASQPDMAGETITRIEGRDFLPLPPLCILVDQNIVETTSRTSDGEKITRIHTEQELFAVFCSASDAGLTIYGATIFVRLESPTAIPVRTSLALTHFAVSSPDIDPEENNAAPPSKRARREGGDAAVVDLMNEVERFAAILSDTLEL